MASGRFIPEADDADLRREKARARELRQSAWWKRRIAAGICHYCRRAVGIRARHHRAARPGYASAPLFGFPVANGHSVVYHPSRKGVVNDPAGLMQGRDY